jgi:hypothetical protein
MAQIAIGLVGLLIAAPLLYVATAGTEHIGQGGRQARGRRRALLIAALVLAVIGLLQVAGGVVELAR